MNQKDNEAPGFKQSDIIEPVSFRPASGAPQIPRVKLPWAQLFVVLIVLAGVWGAWYVVTARSVHIVAEPADALIALDELLAPHIGEHWVLRPGPRLVVVEAPGYHSFRDDIVVTNDVLQTHKITLQPLPGKLNVKVSPVTTADVTIDNLIEATAPGVISNIDAGPREVKVSADRYIPFETVVEIEGKGVEQELVVVLNPAWADVSLDSQPSGANVQIDGEILGTTPLEVELIEGQRDVEISLEGYKTWQRTMAIVAGENLDLPPVLLRKADGFISVTSNPTGASVTVNGEFKGQAPIKFAVVPEKSHKIAARKDGYSQASKTTSVESGKTQNISLKLEPELAALQVITTPKDAELFIDGSSRGSANQILKLPTHAHKLEIRKSGYVTYTTSITPRKGIRKQVKVRLKTPSEAASAPAVAAAASPGGQKVKTFAGQDLKLFRGGKITMGSSRREPGRRANETLREANLRRPFYFGVKEVTNGEFRRFLANHQAPPINSVNVDGDNYPVVNVSWQSAALYCNWLSRKDSLPIFYQIKNGQVLGINPAATGYRLPTEAEWSWVARTAPKSEETFTFPWAGKFPPRGRSGNYADVSASKFLGRTINDYNDGFAATAPVGSFPASLRGIHDLGGNVSEWTNDYYSATPASQAPLDDPLGPRNGESRVIKGSNWAQATEQELRFAYRDFGNDARDDVGFRLARYAQ